MPNGNLIFLSKLLIFLALNLQSINCQADTKPLNKADSLFNQKSYQEAYILYEQLLDNQGLYSPAMLLKMAFISEAAGEYGKATSYLSRYYDYNPDPKVLSKIQSLTGQSNLEGYEVSDWDLVIQLYRKNEVWILGILTLALTLSLILFAFRKEVKFAHTLPALFFLIMIGIGNNILRHKASGLVIGSPTLILSGPTAAGQLVQKVEPGHRVEILGKEDIWYHILWKGEAAYIKQSELQSLSN